MKHRIIERVTKGCDLWRCRKCKKEGTCKELANDVTCQVPGDAEKAPLEPHVADEPS